MHYVENSSQKPPPPLRLCRNMKNPLCLRLRHSLLGGEGEGWVVLRTQNGLNKG